MKIIVCFAFTLSILFNLAIKNSTIAQTVLLYKNSFESPLIPPVTNCSPDLDNTFVNVLWGGTGTGTGGGGQFQQVYTVETILINGPMNQYTDSSGLGGNYCLSMLSSLQNDKIALTLNSQMLPFANISFLISPIDLPACGGPFGLDSTVMYLTVYDSPGGNFNFSSPGTLLDQDTVSGGGPGVTPYTFNWSLCFASLDISGSADGNITVVFDFLKGGYGALDSIEISSSTSSGIAGYDDDLNRVKVYPNPFSNELTIYGTDATSEIIIYDVTGKIVIQTPALHAVTEIFTSNLTRGFYLLNYRAGTERRNFKLIKY